MASEDSSVFEDPEGFDGINAIEDSSDSSRYDYANVVVREERKGENLDLCISEESLDSFREGQNKLFKQFNDIQRNQGPMQGQESRNIQLNEKFRSRGDDRLISEVNDKEVYEFGTRERQ